MWWSSRVLLFSSAAFFVVRASTEFQVPVFLWSPSVQGLPNHYIDGHDAVIRTKEVAQLLDQIRSDPSNTSAWKPSSSSSSSSSSTSSVMIAETLVVLLVQELRTDLIQPGCFVEELISSAKSYAILPSTSRDSPLLNALDGKVLEAKAVGSFLRSREGQELLRNGKTDMVVVRLPQSSLALHNDDDDDDDDTLIRQVIDAFGDNAIYALTGNVMTPVSQEYQALFLPVASRRLQDFSHYVYITPDILTGILTGFFFLSTVLLGLTCMNGIQTPTRFSLQAPPHGKEY